MLGLIASRKRSNREGAEKPFWISFSDLMTALMVLFLVVMAAALLSVTQAVRHAQAQERDRALRVESCMSQVEEYTRTIPGVELDERTVYFGPLAQFQNNSSALDQAQKEFLGRFIPRVLAIARAPTCKAFLKQITVEGFSSQRGSYLHNLDLSTRRSERVLCALLEPAAGNRLSEADRKQIQELFFVGGYSFNSTQASDEDSRRIELKLEFYALNEKQDIALQKKRQAAVLRLAEDTSCPIGDK
jgi:outer membrane protein OmpA-like peptidoglycan-associated protein